MPYHLELEADDVGYLEECLEFSSHYPFYKLKARQSLRRILRQLKKLAKEKV